MILTSARMILLYIMAVTMINLSSPATALSSDAHGKKPGTISVTGTAHDSYTPDTVEIVIAVESRNITAAGAAKNNSAIMDKVIKKLKRILDPEKDTIKTTSYSLRPRYEYGRKKEKNILVGYTAANRISVKTSSTGMAGEIIDSAISAGANRVQSITFSIADIKAPCKTLLAAAAGNALDEAKTVASAFGSEISGLKNASSSCSTDQRPIMRHDLMLESKAAMASTPIEAGEIKVTAVVQSVFLLEE